MRQGFVLLVLASVLMVSLYYLVKYEGYLQVRYRVWKTGGWEIVRIYGFDEGGPHYTVTDVELAVKDRSDTTVLLSLGHLETLRDGEPIRVHGMKALRLDNLHPRRWKDPRLSARERDELRHSSGAVDVTTTEPLGHLFPHPIRNLDDLRIHYDEVYVVFSRLVANQSNAQLKE